VLFNVVGELIEETERGTLEIEIQCEGVAQSDEMRLTFRVSGPAGSGSACAEKTDTEERFEPFAQTFDRSGLPFGGQRLGLALARRVARLLGGDLNTASGKSFYQYRAFTLWLPAGSAREVNFIAKVSEGDLKVRDGSLFSGNSQPLDGMDVLLVEDSADIQILVRHFLKKFGASVELAENGEEGVARARERSYDVILMDLQLPLLNGFEATRQLRENGYRSPIIALTAHALSDVRERCLKNGFDEYMTKPIHAAALIQVLERYLPGQARHN
jgi:CheY-like chemotaxis protein